MIVKNSQQDVVIDLDESVTDIAIKISGGADSAILTYILALYKRDYRPDINIHAITSISSLKPYQQEFADRILAKVADMTGITWGNRYVNTVDSNNYTQEQLEFALDLKSKNAFQYVFVGETKNPPQEELDTICDGPDGREGENMPTQYGMAFMPFKNINKKGICELYETLGVLEDIFPLTRSCEEFPTTDFSKHCEECWFCAERYWGFGRYV